MKKYTTLEYYQGASLEEKRVILNGVFESYKSLVNHDYSIAYRVLEQTINFWGIGKDETPDSVKAKKAMENKNYGYARMILEDVMTELIINTVPSKQFDGD